MVIKIVVVCVLGALTFWICNLGMKRGARTPQGAVLGGVPQTPACPKCGGPSTAPATPCASCQE